MTIQENIFLKDFTTFKIGGPARFFVRAKTVEELQEACMFAHEHALPVFALGAGSNILVSDAGFSGVVVKNEIEGVTYDEHVDGNVEVVAGAGFMWDALVAETVDRGLYGLENLSSIPGTVGAGPVQNIGAYGVEIKDTVMWVEALHSETAALRRFSRDECHFGYRMSFFKTPEGKKYIITKVGFNLRKNGALNLNYTDVAEYMKKHEITQPTLKQVRDAIVEIRARKLPNLAKLGTAGSFFKNSIISEKRYAELLRKFPGIPKFSSGHAKGLIKVPTGWILDNLCGFKGYREGAVGVYENQALVLVNFGNAQASQVQELAQKMVDSVKEKTGIEIEREVEYI